MLRKSILIGLFVLKNNRTIGEPKNLQGGSERQLSPCAFFSGGYGRHREMEEFFAWTVTGGTGINGLKSARIVDFCGKLSRFMDFENTVDCGSAVSFGADSGLCLS